MIPGVDMACLRRELAEIDARGVEVGKAIAREKGQLASADLAAEVKRMWVEAQADNGEEARWPEFWESLGIERQREIVRSTVRVTVHSARKYPRVPSRDVERIVVERLT
jgi:site-specific DNA recombinase